MQLQPTRAEDIRNKSHMKMGRLSPQAMNTIY